MAASWSARLSRRQNCAAVAAQQKTSDCFSRRMVAKIELGPSIGHFGKELHIVAVHMHNTFVNGKLKPELQFIGHVLMRFMREAQSRRRDV
jgi:hypothetical protein